MLSTHTLDQFASTVSSLIEQTVTPESVIKFNQPLLDWLNKNCYGGFSDALISSGREIAISELYSFLEDEPNKE